MPKVLYDTICTLTELRYFVFHGNFYADGAEAYQMEFWIRHIDGSRFKSDAERQKVIQFS
ncbi:putative ACT domain-containing protein ACR1-12 [Helianthus annuus]|uniref:ACT domain-containing protein ACR n=1 Tax=Helianthus annuus TaxID=4232 RepID=A0A9K3H1B1_HELAN|nr:putative ACT domain-containing protein ACR1-12 [Helianthus annuus]KAJ0830206.1 putative ACT domain-containing protein ACR1-12 [Helianthus annuus]